MAHISYSLNFFEGVICGIIVRTSIGLIKGATRRLDYGSYVEASPRDPQGLRWCQSGSLN